jgi:hypothetical protein
LIARLSRGQSSAKRAACGAGYHTKYATIHDDHLISLIDGKPDLSRCSMHVWLSWNLRIRRVSGAVVGDQPLSGRKVVPLTGI